ncbi:unnamed protein product [Cutaneotrichosporon oleaginosum]
MHATAALSAPAQELKRQRLWEPADDVSLCRGRKAARPSKASGTAAAHLCHQQLCTVAKEGKTLTWDIVLDYVAIDHVQVQRSCVVGEWNAVIVKTKRANVEVLELRVTPLEFAKGRAGLDFEEPLSTVAAADDDVDVGVLIGHDVDCGGGSEEGVEEAARMRMGDGRGSRGGGGMRQSERVQGRVREGARERETETERKRARDRRRKRKRTRANK